MSATPSPSFDAGALAAGATVLATTALVGRTRGRRGDASSSATGCGTSRPLPPGPFDGASATRDPRRTTTVPARSSSGSRVSTVRSPAGRYGAHLHVGPCVTGVGRGSRSPPQPQRRRAPCRRRHDRRSGSTSPSTGGGTARSVAHVDWFPDAGAALHRHARASHRHADGTAGARLACLPVEW